jgi:hypothetical protein
MRDGGNQHCKPLIAASIKASSGTFRQRRACTSVDWTFHRSRSI